MSKILEVTVIGILFGLLTHIANKYLPPDLRFLVETKLIWLIPAFLVAFNLPARCKKGDTIFFATATIFVTGFTYYTSETVKNHGYWNLSTDLYNLLRDGLIFGIATGFIAHLSRSATNQFIRYGSASLLPAIFTGDGINEIFQNLQHFSPTPEIITKSLGGIVLYFLVAGRHRFSPKSLLSFSILAIIAALIYLYML